MENNDVLIQRHGHLGHLVLNRPKAMNALTHGMVVAMAAALAEWETDDAVTSVAISGAGERGLCAGGDIVSIYHDARTGGNLSEQFWRDEYRLNAQIKNYPKPIVALMDGVVLGGGVGISAHASHRVVTERTRIGMPETGIGFVPDVGGTYLLAHAPGELGTHVALTGGMFTGADAIALGLADHFIDSTHLATLLAELSERTASAAVARYGQVPPTAPLLAEQGWIDGAYTADSVDTILGRLAPVTAPAAAQAAATLASKSPTALTVTLAALRLARTQNSLEEALNQEFRVSMRALRWPDFAEGIRAQLVDRDRNPVWSPATLAAVSEDVVTQAFENLGDRELGLVPHTVEMRD